MTSVLIPVYNGAHVLDRTVPAVLALQGVDEWVWVDDGSTDGTVAHLHRLVESEPRARVVQHAHNRGRGAARNTAARTAGGDTLVFLDVDARPPPDAVLRFQAALALPGVVATTAQIRTVVEQPSDPYQHYLTRFPRGAPPSGIDQPLAWRYFLTCACALTRAGFESTGGFDPSISYGEDFALACRLRQRAPHGLRLAETVVDLFDAAVLPQALKNVAEFGHALPSIEAACPGAREMSGVGPFWLGPAGRAVCRWATPALRIARALSDRPRLLPPRVVRYVLALTFLAAYHGARPDSP